MACGPPSRSAERPRQQAKRIFAPGQKAHYGVQGLYSLNRLVEYHVYHYRIAPDPIEFPARAGAPQHVSEPRRPGAPDLAMGANVSRGDEYAPSCPTTW